MARYPKTNRKVSELRDRNVFMESVVSSEDGCWIWTGGQFPTGYGRAGRSTPAHRVSYEYVFGKIEPGLHLHHVCSVPLCVNPSHLVAVTVEQHRRLESADITHCPQGHMYSHENTRYRNDGHARVCMECDRRRSRDYGRIKYATDPVYRAKKLKKRNSWTTS